MPTYEYNCRKCGKRFTIKMSMGEHARKRVRCPKCASSQVARMVQAFFATTSKKS